MAENMVGRAQAWRGEGFFLQEDDAIASLLDSDKMWRLRFSIVPWIVSLSDVIWRVITCSSSMVQSLRLPC